MRIAVYLPAIAPNEGGAFTFQKSIFESLAELAPASSHEFLVYCRGAASATAKNVRTIETRRGLSTSVRARTSVLLRNIQDRHLGWRPVDLTSWFEASVHAEGVDAVWFPTTQFEECEIPYVYTIWDMQHLVHRGSRRSARAANGQRATPCSGRTSAARCAPSCPIARGAGSDDGLRIPENRLLLLPHPTPRIEPPSTEEIDRVLRKYSLARGYLFYPVNSGPTRIM